MASLIAVRIPFSSHKLAPALYCHLRLLKRFQLGKLFGRERNQKMIKLKKIVRLLGL